MKVSKFINNLIYDYVLENGIQQKDLNKMDELFVHKKKLIKKINKLKVKSKDFECCLEILNELEEYLEERI